MWKPFLRGTVPPVVAVALLACAEPELPKTAERIVPAAPRPAFTLRTTDGRPYDFRTRTAGRLTVLVFGYTHCPDVCPLELATLARVQDRLPRRVVERLQVVFVTTDPERDTPARLRDWVVNFHPLFEPLHGSPAEITAALEQSGLAPSLKTERDSAGNYLVIHAAQLLVYTPDDSLHMAYLPTTRAEDWARELPRLLERYGS
ncbi:MAG: SCO family protein [Gemmatimonadales bacterium]|nr:SCO family protein [Gemmatimonadales bacterium]